MQSGYCIWGDGNAGGSLSDIFPRVRLVLLLGFLSDAHHFGAILEFVNSADSIVHWSAFKQDCSHVRADSGQITGWRIAPATPRQLFSARQLPRSVELREQGDVSKHPEILTLTFDEG
jgi:hypothetical protein